MRAASVRQRPASPGRRADHGQTKRGVKLSVVIPALNEELAIGDVIGEIPIAKLGRMGYDVEVIVVDNGSVDETVHIARVHGATVVMQPMRGYGNAYKAGFAYSTGDVVATGDADLTYPFADLPEILRLMERRDLEFVNTDRLSGLKSGTMTRSHILGNWMLSSVTKTLFGWPFKDSQSGMWIFKRYVWDALDVRSSGMPFSQELKIEAFAKGFRCDEVPIEYRARAGQEKLNTIADGLGNILHLVRKRIALSAVPKPPVTSPSTAATSVVSLDGGSEDSLWDERWYDSGAIVSRSVPARGPHIPLPALASADLAASPGQTERIVVWRARPTVSATSRASSYSPSERAL